MSSGTFYLQGQVVYDTHTNEKYTLVSKVNNFSSWWWVTVDNSNIKIQRPEKLFKCYGE